LVALLIISTSFTGLWGQSANLPLDYWGYSFLDRLEAKGLFKSHDLRARPLSRVDVARIILSVDEGLQKSAAGMTQADRQLYEQLRGDFAVELAALGQDCNGLTKERHLLEWSENTSSLSFDLVGKEAVVSNRGQSYQPEELLSETTAGGLLRGQLGGKVGYYLDARNAVTRGSVDVREEDEEFDLSKGSPVVISGPNVIQDRAVAYFVVEAPWLRIEAGRDEIEWGPGYHGALTVSRNMPPADMIKLSSRFRRFKFTSSHAFLQSGIGSKYLAAHRLDLMLTPGLYIGGTETVIYGKRDVELSYLNPIMPYHIAEHHLGDRDNNMLSVDITSTLIPSTKLYGEFFIDDMTSTQSLTKYFGNKFAFLLGGLLVDPLKLSNLDIRFEYARIEPYVYSHWDSVNIYTNYDKIIGHWLGPNSDSAFLQAGLQLGRDTRLEGNFERIRKGTGQANTHSRPDQGLGKKFLDGVVEHRRLLGIKLVEQIRRDVFVSVSYTYSDARNTDQIAGKRAFDHLARFECYLNY
jgi:hypothetical protein